MIIRITQAAIFGLSLVLSQVALAQHLSSQSVDYEKQEGKLGNLAEP